MERIGIPVEMLNRLVEELRRNGIWAERHSYSIRGMYNGKFVVSMHIYPGYRLVNIRLYSGDEKIDDIVFGIVKRAVDRYLKGYLIEAQRLYTTRFNS